MSSYPFDPDVREEVARRLLSHLPSLYQVLDRDPTAGRGDLERFTRVLAAPLAEVRQNIEELRADLFIDSCNDWVIPYLAQMVAVDLMFPDERSNRLDVKKTVGWRRRKGTPAMLEELATDLSGSVAVTHEGWQRVMMTQDLNLPRLERTTAKVGEPLLAVSNRGPTDRAHHTLDAREITQTTGRYHPRHVTHWMHPTRLFPLEAASPFERTTLQDADRRFAFDPLGRMRPLRQRRVSADDEIETDRIGLTELLLEPARYFAREGRFSVRVLGLDAAVAAASSVPRSPSRAPADPALVDPAPQVSFRLLDHVPDRLTDEVRIELFAAPLVGDTPDVLAAVSRGGLTLGRGGKTGDIAGANAPVVDPVALIRLSPVNLPVAHFSGATVEIVSASVQARRAAGRAELAAQGFLRGALIVQLPDAWVDQARWLLVAADGSTYDVGALLPVQGGWRLPGEALAVGPGAAWPVTEATASATPLRRVAPAPGPGPQVLRPTPVIDDGPGGPAPAAGGTAMALVFAALVREIDVQPFLRLSWTGPDPFGASAWVVLDDLGAPVPDAAAEAARLAEIAGLEGQQTELVLRFECGADQHVLVPAEILWCPPSGEGVLVHTPELRAAPPTGTPWPAGLPFVSLPVRVAEDGATRLLGGLLVARRAHGAVAPLAAGGVLRRRRLGARCLRGWDDEDPVGPPPKLMPPTPDGALDVDPDHGLFSLSKNDALQAHLLSVNAPPLAPVQATVTVDVQDGFTSAVGARPLARAPILSRPHPEPTRVVSRSGRLAPDASPAHRLLPRHASLTEALAAAGASGLAREVIQFEDSATYDEAPVWPVGPRELVVQAAERVRPVLRLAQPWLAASDYDLVELTGLAFAGADITVPACARVSVRLCSVWSAEHRFTFEAAPEGVEVRFERCVLAAVRHAGVGRLVLDTCVVDADVTAGPGARAIEALEAEVELEHVTVFGEAPAADALTVEVFVLHASESVFEHRVRAIDKFEGCIRYSRAHEASELPRRHRVVHAPLRFVSRQRGDPAHARLREDQDPAVSRGAEDGSEMGAFCETKLLLRRDGLIRRLHEYTPAGLVTGLVRLD